jgi:hypothetical protein
MAANASSPDGNSMTWCPRSSSKAAVLDAINASSSTGTIGPRLPPGYRAMDG